MRDFNPIKAWRQLLSLPNDNLTKTLVIAFIVAFTASVLVSVSAVALRPYHLANQEAERKASMETMIATLPGMEDILTGAGVDNLEVQLVDLNTGEFSNAFDPASFDQRAAATDPNLSTALPSDVDIAGIKTRENFAQVFILRKDGDLHLVVLPIHAVGYQSTIYAYLALNADANTIAGLTIYEQGETPGIGSRILEPSWLALWPGKLLADENGEIKISVMRGNASGPYEVDGVSGATRSSNGVANMLTFWLGDYGFGPFLTRLRAGEI